MGTIIAVATFLIIGSHQWGISEGHIEEANAQKMYCSQEMTVKECKERIENKTKREVEYE